MAGPHKNGPRYEVHASGLVAAGLRRLQLKAKRQGRGEEMLAALHQIHDRIQKDPNTAGEPVYRLPVLRMCVRTIVIRPLMVDFAVCEDHPSVFIKGARLLSR